VSAKKCQWKDGCRYDAITKERFCPLHRKAMLNEMRDSGYLTPIPKDARPAREDHGDEQEEEA
jgi:hypothetical protein